MKYAFLLYITSILYGTLYAQKNKVSTPVYAIDSTKVLTLDKTIKTLYQTISGEKAAKRNWGQFKFLFKPEAQLIASYKSKKSSYNTKYMSANTYIKNSSKWFNNNGFIQKEIHRVVNSYNNITQVFSTFNSYHNTKDKHPFMRGIYSIQLLNDGKRWWIVNMYWTNESINNPIPKIYLP